MLANLFRRRRKERNFVDALHGEIVAVARRPEFYRRFGAPDTLEGRFEILALHGFLVVRRLNNLGVQGRERAQELTDSVFRHLDIALRETGVSDIGVPKKMKKFASAYLGRAAAYGGALDAADAGRLAEALSRNVFGGVFAPDCPRTQALARYAMAADAIFAAAPLDAFQPGRLVFPDPGNFLGEGDD